MTDLQMSSQDSRNNNNNNVNFICGVVEGFYGKPWTCEQRKDLFKRLKELGLNTFMYAPKDDTKHRAKWRQLYSDREAEELKTLISEARANGIDFYYSLAPGLDMIYSDSEELDLLKRKYDQVVSLGCESFAILFDDIEPRINDKDRKVFEDYASAQVAVTNIVYEHLKKPKFLFCPTEYCESRAVPSVLESHYLNTLGTGLNLSIDIMWSGSRVISRLITEESVETLTKVIRRPPVIWENLHANDYDKKRVFLGPYSGRSTKIIPKLKGVLTNPNCEYEANYIAIHTLAQWTKCTEDINTHNCCNLSQKLSESTDGNLMVDQLRDSVYDPSRALANAIRDWLPHVMRDRSLPPELAAAPQPEHRDDNLASSQIAREGENLDKELETEESNVEMIPEETRSSATSVSTNKSEMDTSCSPAPTNVIDTNSCESCDMQDTLEANMKTELEHKILQPTCSECLVCGKKDTSQMTTTIPIGFDNLSLLVDLFYLPFEHGSRGYSLLRDIRWLKDNSDILTPSNTQEQSTNNTSSSNIAGAHNDDTPMTVADEAPTSVPSETRTVRSWVDRAEKLNNLCTCINQLVNTLIYDCPNKLLVIELYPYLADLRDATALVIDYVKFLRNKTSTQDRFYYSNAAKQRELTAQQNCDEQEPWVHRGGLIGDVQRLIS